MEITCPVFIAGQPVPRRYTCGGENVSPPLHWSGIPQDAHSLAVIIDDPDAPDHPDGPFVHWIVYNIPPESSGLADGFSKEINEQAGIQGKNDLETPTYTGPCPPDGATHKYQFQLFALDDRLSLGPGASREDLYQSMEGHILDHAELVIPCCG